MKHLALILAAAAMLLAGPLCAQVEPTVSDPEQPTPQDQAPPAPIDVKHYGEYEAFRRSSLCIIMITHEGKEYAQEIQEEFLQTPLPERYNPHNIHFRAISTQQGALEEDDVIRLMGERGVAKELVQRWFNYNPATGQMDMSVVHPRGRQNASYADVQRVGSTERGVAQLSDEGLELIQNTFVLVCDMTYYDRDATGNFLSILSTAASIYMDISAEEQARKGHKNQAANLRAGAAAARVGAAVADDLGGFSVKMRAHLLRLKWDDNLSDKVFGEYWVDADTPADEAAARRQAFENDRTSFGLEYIGMYKTKTGKTVFQSKNDMRQVIRRVCSNTVNEGMAELAHKYPIFRPKTTFDCDGSFIYAHIGRKEGVEGKSEFEVIQRKRKGNELTYKKVTEAKPYRIWDNREINNDEVDFSVEKGTSFRCKKNDVCDQGYLIREAK